MSGNDNLLMNNLERALSGDVNDLQSLQARVLAEFSRYTFSRRAQGLLFSDSTRQIAMGLGVSAAGSNVVVSEGVLFQQSATLPPAPGALDSNYRLARLDSAATIVGPVPGVNSWYLLEAQMVQQVASSSVRDIYNPATQTFVPTLVDKILVNSIQFQLTAGGADIPFPSGGNWVPLAAVEWPAGGGAPLQIYDLRTLPDVNEGGFPINPEVDQQLVVTNSLPDAPSNNIAVSARASNFLGKLGGTSSVPFDATSAAVVEPGTVFSADTWYYLYLSAWSPSAIKPQGGQLPAFAFSGVLVLSATPPFLGATNPSAFVQLPAPFSLMSAGTAAVCVGAVRRNSANTGWICSEESDRQGVVTSGIAAGAIVTDFDTQLGVPSFSRAIDFSTTIPRHARTAIVELQFQTNNIVGSPTGYVVTVFRTGDVNPYILTRVGLRDSVRFEWPVAKLGDLATVSALLQPASSADISVFTLVVGWRS